MCRLRLDRLKKAGKVLPTMNIKVKVTDIVYDTDGESDLDLPNGMIVEVDGIIDIESEVADAISDKTGWCVSGYNYEIL